MLWISESSRGKEAYKSDVKLAQVGNRYIRNTPRGQQKGIYVTFKRNSEPVQGSYGGSKKGRFTHRDGREGTEVSLRLGAARLCRDVPLGVSDDIYNRRHRVTILGEAEGGIGGSKAVGRHEDRIPRTME